MSRPYDDADDLQEREIYLRDRGVDHEEEEMWYPTDCPILESVFLSHAPDAIDLHEIFGNFPTRPYSYAELANVVNEGMIF